MKRISRASILFCIAAIASQISPAIAQETAGKNIYWGDTHLHTSNSFDAFLNFNYSADPETAYNYAKGKPVIHPYHRAHVQINDPLDFLVIADHAELLGAIRTTVQKEIPTEGLGLIDTLKAWYIDWKFKDIAENYEGPTAFVDLLPLNQDPIQAATEPSTSPIPNLDLMSKNTWQDAVQLADKHNEPGTFTTLIGWEWSSIPGGANLHRVVFTDSGADVAGQFQPFSLQDSQYPEDLWKWLDETSERTGADFVAIPHNSNISKGFMFPKTTIRDEPVDLEYAELRSKWETVVEVTQIKGDSETHPILSATDEFANFETYAHYIEQEPPAYDPGEGDYVRSGLRRGLEFEEQLGVNPFKFGLIGATDSHTGLASAEENNFHGKMARLSTPENNLIKRGNISNSDDGPSGWSMSASGLAAVWAEENTRESILAAFKRKEVYATSGPKIAVRFYAGWDFSEEDALPENLATAGASKGVAMGGDLLGSDANEAPKFLVQAIADPNSANLDRVQIIKGWLNSDGSTDEKIFNIAWSDAEGGVSRELDNQGDLPTVGDTVDLSTAKFSNTIGTAQLATYWADPEFDAEQRAFYYVRVLEIPTPRHTLTDALALGLSEAPNKPSVIQERAYTSPIWYTPQ